MNESSFLKEGIPVGKSFDLLHPRTGQIVVSENAGEIRVTYDGAGPYTARLLSGISRSELLSVQYVGREVLLVFDGGRPEKPIVVGVLENVLENLVCLDGETDPLPPPVEVCSDGDRTVIEAGKEMVLKCGEGSITIKKEGRIVIRGKEIISRASGTNKIKGGSVELN